MDPIAATIALLKLDADLRVLVGDRIYGEELPCGESKYQPRGAVVLRHAPNGLLVGGYLEFDWTGFDVFCNGATPKDAVDIYLEVKRILKRARRQVVQETLIHSFDMVAGGRGLREPATHWPYTLSSWTVLAAENQAV